MILIEGGLVSGVYSDHEAVIGAEVVVNNYDRDGERDDDLVDLLGGDCWSHVHIETVQKLGPETTAAVGAWRAKQ